MGTKTAALAYGLAWSWVLLGDGSPRGLAQEISTPPENAESKIGPVDPTLAKEKFRSLEILHDMPAWQMGKVMNLMSEALGVSCTHCHEGYDFPKEGKRAKEVAREMVKMTDELNARFFHGEQRVTCWSCHRGERIPKEVAAGWPVSGADAKERWKGWEGTSSRTRDVSSQNPAISAGSAPTASSVPTVAELWTRHRNELGIPDDRAWRMHLIGERWEPNGEREQEEVWLGGLENYRVETQYGKSRVVEGWDGSAVMKRWEQEPIRLQRDEELMILRESQVLRGEDLQSRFEGSHVQKIERPDERPRWRVQGHSVAGIVETVDFDSESGLVVARTQRIETRLGPYILEVRYGDHRRVAGIVIPHRIGFAMPGVRWEREIKQVEPESKR